jgi:signal transduction histidine kinase
MLLPRRKLPLAERGYDTQGFATGTAALAALQQSQVDVLLSDLMMPGMDGTTLLRTALELVPDLVGIIMTGYGTIQTAVEAMRIGALDYVLKPVTLSKLLPMLSRAIEVRRLRMARRIFEAERQEAARLKENLLSVVSHELRTPLTSLRGFAELLLTRTLPADKQQQFLTIIHKETVRLSHLINDFLDLQRMQAGHQVYHLISTNLAAVLRHAVSVFALESGSHIIRVEVPDGLPDVHADAERLCQVLANLLSNAIKFSPHSGEVTVGARAHGAQALVWVTDHGLGIPPEAVPKLFSKFYRVEHHESRHIGGTGLALVKEIVEAHHGSVWVESVLGQGSTFFFTVPVALPAPHEPTRNDIPAAEV